MKRVTKLRVKVFKHGIKAPVREREFKVDSHLDWVEVWEIPGAKNLVIRVEIEEAEEE